MRLKKGQTKFHYETERAKRAQEHEMDFTHLKKQRHETHLFSTHLHETRHNANNCSHFNKKSAVRQKTLTFRPVDAFTNGGITFSSFVDL